MERQMQDRALRTRELLLRAAAEEFDAAGYAGTGLNKIAKRAGLTVGALYFHFESKEGIARAVMMAQPESIEPHVDTQGLQRIVDITRVWSHQLLKDPLLRAGVRLSVEQGSFGVNDISPYLQWRDVMEQCLCDARDSGELLPGVDPRWVAEFVVSACTGVQLYAQLVNGRKDLPERTVEMWRLLLPGIATPGTLPRIDLSPRRGDKS
ncbi:TetR family transcriptional regulator [Streptomyces sp. WZ.A104]|uniref:ScbR family autoregulator-binding transcription factor n=1 Tax=Streptomyces durocortorensis TaxID=2811104 RepID=A0ABY9VZJ2_9ACTN|nr:MULTISPECIES: ScbR family autoregulator-binding transcription factor [Streptomyces]PCG85393.1 TetR family transcriptional regulator [Streptomyces sp. WZ.A104]WNF29321.1 ScbR family autoregulator-binding transcription factor [Streptomyces durocortorensis]